MPALRSPSATGRARAALGAALALAAAAPFALAADALAVAPTGGAAKAAPVGTVRRTAKPAPDAPARSTAKPAPTELLLTFRERPGLHAFVKAVSDPRSSRYRRYATVEALAARYGAAPKQRRAVAAWAAANGLRLQLSPTATFAIASGDADEIAAAVGAGGLARASSRDGRVPVPSGLRAGVGGAAVLSQQRLATDADPAPAAPAPRAARAAARRAAGRARAAGRRAHPAQAPAAPTPDAILAQLFGSAAERTGTPGGCAAGARAGETIPFPDGATPIPLALYGYTPNQYTTAYGHAAMHRRGFRGEGMRVAVLEIDGFKRSDVATFATCFGAGMPKIARKAVGVRRFPAPGGETTLDLEVLIGSLPRLGAIDVVGTSATAANLLKGAIATLGTPRTRPDVISVSLGICEPALAGQVTAMRAISDVYAVAAGAGISTLAATGDTGVTGCDRQGGPSMIAAVSAPATVPFVTAVGGTNVTLDAANRLVSQRTWNNAPRMISGGGGGISVLFEAPWWQGGASGGAGGRAVPDVAALGDPFPGYAIYCTTDDADCAAASGWQTIGGTSAATPLTAAAIVLADQQAKRSGQQPLGLLNPLIYALGGGRPATYSGAISDVTSGSNDVGLAVPRDANGGRPIGQFSAEKGYDLATGWGSLKVEGFSREAVRVAKRQAAKADGDDTRLAATR